MRFMLSLLILAVSQICYAYAVTLDGVVQLDIRQQDSDEIGRSISKFKLYVPLAQFSVTPNTVAGRLQLPPADNAKLCESNSSASLSFPPKTNEDFILLVPRGPCSFEQNSANAETLYGASGLLVYNTLESRYGWNETSEKIRYPINRYDYECSNGGVAVISTDDDSFTLDPPAYNGTIHDPLLTLDSPDNICELPEPADCDSQRCLVINNTYVACCAWDVPIEMAGDSDLPESEKPSDTFVAAFLTMQQGDDLLSQLQQEQQVLFVTISHRDYPRFNLSSFIMWLFATTLIGGASWLSAWDYRWARKRFQEGWFSFRDGSIYREMPPPRPPVRFLGQPTPTVEITAAGAATTGVTTTTVTTETQEHAGTDEEQPSSPQEATDNNDETMEAADNTITQGEQEPAQAEQTAHPPAPSSPRRSRRRLFSPSIMASSTSTPRRGNQVGANPNSLELNVWHAVFFVIVASTLLLLLFYFEFYRAVTVMYGIGCSGAMSHVLIKPGMVYSLHWMYRGVSYAKRRQQDGSHHVPRYAMSPWYWWNRPLATKYTGNISWMDVVANIAAYAVGAVWIYVGFTDDEPITNTFFWVTQNTMGACLTILMFILIHLNSIKVATVLLVVIFIYDIFFVFLSPYLFDGDSVMVEVATGGGSSGGGDSSLCDKYPDLGECEGGHPLPMLFAIPRINDYRGGSTLLGLGDVILPGFLLSFAARLDEAKRLIARHTELDVTKAPTKWYQGYLVPLIIAYAFGLLMAMLAVVLMERGQPALLYIVPACLGAMFWIGWCEIGELWKGPVVIRWSDRIVTFMQRVATTPRSDRNRGDSVQARPSAVTPVEPQESTGQPQGSSTRALS